MTESKHYRVITRGLDWNVSHYEEEPIEEADLDGAIVIRARAGAVFSHEGALRVEQAAERTWPGRRVFVIDGGIEFVELAPAAAPPFVDLPDEGAIRAELDAVLEQFNERVGGLGRLAYKQLDLATDSRDFAGEALDEVVDALFYVGALLTRYRRDEWARRTKYFDLERETQADGSRVIDPMVKPPE